MIKLTSSRLLASLCCVLMIGAVLSCNKDDDKPNDGKAALYSFGPTGAKHGDTLRFIGVNLEQVNSIRFTGENALVDKSKFTSQTSDLIKLIVPEAAEKGYVVLQLANGDSIKTKTQLNLDVLTTISSMTAQARPGENITINGNYLNWIDRVTFERNKVVSTFEKQNMTQLVVKVPANAQTGTLVLHYGGTDSADLETADTLKVTLPMIASMSPIPVKPGSDVTITGTDLDLAKKVIFNGVTTPVISFVSQSATQLVVTVPAAAKKGKLTLEAASGVQTTSTNDLDIVLPAITAMSPNPINLGANLTLTGTDLDLTSKVIFSGVASPVTSFVSKSATQLVVTVPAGARDGKVKVEAASGVQTTSANDLDVILPSVTSMSPNPADPGSNLTITGTGLDVVTSVAFQNAPKVTSFVSQSASQIVVTVPTGVLKGKIILGLSNPADTVMSTDELDVTGSAPPPTIALPFYTDAVTSNWTNNQGWLGGGWNGTANVNNTSPVREGSKSVKIDYVGGWGSPFQLGRNSTTVDVSSYTTFKISIYGGPGTNGKKVAVELNKDDTKAYAITLVEGKWTDYSIPLSTLMGSATGLYEIWVKEFNGTGGFTIYVDDVGVN